MSTDAACVAIIAVILTEKERSTKRKRKQWVKDWIQKRRWFGHENLIAELELSSSSHYTNYLSMDSSSFGELLGMVSPLIQRNDTVMRDAISPNQRLYATLRYLVSGHTFEELKFSTAIAAQTLGRIIIETCEAIRKVLRDYIKVILFCNK